MPKRAFYVVNEMNQEFSMGEREGLMQWLKEGDV